MTAFLVTSTVLLWAVVLALCVSVFAVYRYIGHEAATTREGRLSQGPRNGARIPAVTVRSTDDAPVQLGGRNGVPTLYFFGSMTCSLCKTALPELALAASQLAPGMRTVAVFNGDASQVLGLRSLVSQDVVVASEGGSRFHAKVGIHSLPFVIVTDQHGRIVNRGSPRVKDGFLAIAQSAPSP